MYLRSTPRRNKDGAEVRYLQLAHNAWGQQKRRSTVQVVYNFGREDPENREALQRLAASITRFLDPDAALAASADGPAFTESRPLGGAWVLDVLWSKVGIGKEMKQLLKGKRRDAAAERVLFALTANRALAPSSKQAASAGSARTPRSPAWTPPPATPATGRWTGCWRSAMTWRRGFSIVSSPF